MEFGRKRCLPNFGVNLSKIIVFHFIIIMMTDDIYESLKSLPEGKQASQINVVRFRVGEAGNAYFYIWS
jgi:hypothetical protein